MIDKKMCPIMGQAHGSEYGITPWCKEAGCAWWLENHCVIVTFAVNYPSRHLMGYEITDPCGYCKNRYGYGPDPDGICPVCERNYRKEDQCKPR